MKDWVWVRGWGNVWRSFEHKYIWNKEKQLRWIHSMWTGWFVHLANWKFGSGGVYESNTCVCVCVRVCQSVMTLTHAGLLRQVETSHSASKTQLFLPPTHADLMLTEHLNTQLRRHDFHTFIWVKPINSSLLSQRKVCLRIQAHFSFFKNQHKYLLPFLLGNQNFLFWLHQKLMANLNHWRESEGALLLCNEVASTAPLWRPN